MIRVRTTETRRAPFEPIDFWPEADDFTVDFESGTLTVKKTNDDGETVALFAVYAKGGWDAVFNDDAVPAIATTQAQDDDRA